VNCLVRTIMDAPEGELTVCTLGPMTNLGMAMAMEPRIASRLREVALMGGGIFQGGNATPAAEFNIFVDPHAAHAVFESRRARYDVPDRLHVFGADDGRVAPDPARTGKRAAIEAPTSPISIGSTAASSCRPARARSMTPASLVIFWRPSFLRSASATSRSRSALRKPWA
jgi:hypothetical protein